MTVRSACTSSCCCSIASNADFEFSVARVTAFAKEGTFLCTTGTQPTENARSGTIHARVGCLAPSYIFNLIWALSTAIFHLAARKKTRSVRGWHYSLSALRSVSSYLNGDPALAKAARSLDEPLNLSRST